MMMMAISNNLFSLIIFIVFWVLYIMLVENSYRIGKTANLVRSN